MNVRKLSSLLLGCLSVIFSLISCSKSSSDFTENMDGAGNVTVRLGFSKQHATRAIPSSTAKPTTSWSKNINQLMALFVDNTGVVKAARVIAVPQENSTNTMQFILHNIPAGNYDVFMVANYNDVNLERLTIGGLWNEGNVVGKRMDALTLSLVANSAYQPNATTETGMQGFKEPAELFMDKKSVRIIADQTESMPAFQLSRAVSILRVRIDHSQNGNEGVDFLVPQSDIRVRKVATTFNPQGGLNPVNPIHVLYANGNGVFKDSEPAGNYTAGKILDPANNITLWSDLLMFPGGSTLEGTKKFDIVIGGLAPVGYTPLGHDTPLASAQMVYWSGQIQAGIVANNILEVNCVLKQSGSVVVPEIGAYGNLDMTINIEDWGNISSTDLEM
ncbi:MAG: hypothetical protein ACRDD8_08370 [Bacteroidales bacterium]